MSHEPTKEYLLLFNTISDMIDNIQDLQVFLMTVDQTVKEMSQTGNVEHVRIACNIQWSVIRWLIAKLQQAHVDIILAQQKAEDLYLDAE